jgi:DNA-binding transcriptional MerR regulator
VAVAEGAYLSIGEVLGLLLEDFPDVTISKIRFLESQGLIEPERTPSGYRKFYEHDVDLLRAILHEQKENFLPLKVIKDRIESGALEADPTAGRTPPRGIRNVEHAAADARGTGRVRQRATPPSERDSVFRRTDGADIEHASARHPAATAPITAAVPVVPSAPEPSRRPPAPPEAEVPAQGDVPLSDASDASDAPVSDTVPRDDGGPAQGARRSGRVPAAATVPADDEREPAVPVAPAVTIKPAPVPQQAHGADGGRQVVSRAELCAAAGIAEEQLAQLEEYGLIVRRGGSDATYTHDAVEVARVAGRFLAQGIDARHLRAWRQSAEREAALFEQRITPLLRQRNPQSRKQALETLTELASLGAELRGALLAGLLRGHFDGDART